MKPSTVVRIRRRVGRWTTHCHPEPEEREALDALDSGPPNVVRDWAAVTHALIDAGEVKAPPQVENRDGAGVAPFGLEPGDKTTGPKVP